ncbi:nitroreductase [Variovorax boronicumulans]|uniref:nitroreductase n=1 Tax=Variovorax boronicumulans TaxID=436515 RepID=UPI002475A6F2|nr:nitroreductase [Variovorax boronicumulans]MDH6166504.1 nitroreductase [Variovorax boronicumulans]
MMKAASTDTTRDNAARRIVDEVIRSRRAVRAFDPTPVPKALVVEMLEVARCAPSNSNTQPWFVHVLEGEARRRLGEALLRSHARDELPASQHFPGELPAACKSRQADFGARYYAALGIDRADAAARYAQTARNYLFFDAPVGLIFTIDRRLMPHSWADFGMFLQTFMLAAKARGLDTCPQVSFVRHEPVVRECLQLPEDQTVVCGMSLGHARTDAALHRIAMPRDPVEAFTVFHGFDGES